MELYNMQLLSDNLTLGVSEILPLLNTIRIGAKSMSLECVRKVT